MTPALVTSDFRRVDFDASFRADAIGVRRPGVELPKAVGTGPHPATASCRAGYAAPQGTHGTAPPGAALGASPRENASHGPDRCASRVRSDPQPGKPHPCGESVGHLKNNPYDEVAAVRPLSIQGTQRARSPWYRAPRTPAFDGCGPWSQFMRSGPALETQVECPAG
jgi:hypothetical protein